MTNWHNWFQVKLHLVAKEVPGWDGPQNYAFYETFLVVRNAAVKMPFMNPSGLLITGGLSLMNRLNCEIRIPV